VRGATTIETTDTTYDWTGAAKVTSPSQVPLPAGTVRVRVPARQCEGQAGPHGAAHLLGCSTLAKRRSGFERLLCELAPLCEPAPHCVSRFFLAEPKQLVVDTLQGLLVNFAAERECLAS
jgi:hypothetical protein